MEEWKKVSLREVTDIIGDGLHGTPLYSSDGEFAFVNGNNLSDGAVQIKADTKMCDLSEYEKYKRDLSDRTLFLSINGTIGNTAKYNGEKIILGKSACYLNVKKDYNLDFIYYVLRTPAFQSAISGLATGTTIKNVSLKIIREYEFSVPDYEGQTRIARVLRAIDDKVELNNRINHNLEEQAQALYKSWFVDYEPFKGGKFVDSELGMIPEGWKIGKINDVINLLSGFPFKSSDFQENGDYQLITIKGVQDGYLDVTSADMLSSLPSKMPQYCILNIGDILISLTGNVGRTCIVDRNNLLLNQRVAILSPKNIRDSFYVYTMFRSESMKDELIHLARGTAQLNLSPIETGEKLTVIPPDSILEAFAKVGKGTFNQYISLKKENIRLMEMRDSLLPKLMSGELKINDLSC